jgi:Domain of unknown function DUF302
MKQQAKGTTMMNRMLRSMLATAFVLGLTLSYVHPSVADEVDGVVRLKSGYGMDETIARIKQDIVHKGIMFFDEIRQSELAAKAGIKLNPSTLLVFGNPPLGTLFLTSNPDSGLDWPAASWFGRMTAARSGLPTRISIGSRAGTTSKTVTPNSGWRLQSSSPLQKA